MFYERVKELVATLGYQGNYHEKIIRPLMSEFGISERIVYKRIKSLFGKTVTQLVQDLRNPTKSQVDAAIMLHTTSDDARKYLGLRLNDKFWVGVFDRLYGVSTFTAAKSALTLREPVVEYNPTRDDNLAILASQRVGDGYYDPKHGYLSIEHGFSQFDYLRFKVGLINKAYPETEGISDVKVGKHVIRGAEYMSARWRTCRLPKGITTRLANTPRHEIVPELTPLGVALYYLDDGYLLQPPKHGQHVLGFGINENDKQLIHAVREMLQSYGITARLKRNGVVVTGMQNVAAFLHNMIHPFKHLLPECVMYKVDMKV